MGPRPLPPGSDSPILSHQWQVFHNILNVQCVKVMNYAPRCSTEVCVTSAHE